MKSVKLPIAEVSQYCKAYVAAEVISAKEDFQEALSAVQVRLEKQEALLKTDLGRWRGVTRKGRALTVYPFHLPFYKSLPMMQL